MFTNLERYGGNFRNILNKEFEAPDTIMIASGYTSLDILDAFTPHFIKTAQKIFMLVLQIFRPVVPKAILNAPFPS